MRTLNSFEGYLYNPVHDVMYAFPRIKLPPKADGKAIDFFLCIRIARENR